MAEKKDFEGLVFEKLGGGFVFTEGPCWFPEENSLLFSDIEGDTVYRWSAEQGMEVYRRPSNDPNGSARDIQGRFLNCERKSRCVSRTEFDGTVTPLITRYRGKRLNSPNDIVVRSDGKIYFTDPCSKRTRNPELDFCGVYMFDPEKKSLRLLTDSLKRPNGLAFSPDERILYVDDTITYHVHAFDVREDGTLGVGRVLADARGEQSLGNDGPDGLKVDAEGNLYVASEGNMIYVISSEGRQIARIPSPNGAFMANFTWGDRDRKTLYVCATKDVYRVRMPVAGCGA